MFCNRVAVILGGTPARGGKGWPGESVGRGAWKRGWGRCHVIASLSSRHFGQQSELTQK